MTFRLASVLRLRERERDQAAHALDQVRQAISILDQRRDELKMEYDAGEEARHGLLHGAVAIHRLLDIQRYQMVLVGQLQHIANQRATLVQEEERRKHALMLRQQAVRALEKLKEHHDEESLRIAVTRQQSRIDEWSITREARNTN